MKLLYSEKKVFRHYQFKILFDEKYDRILLQGCRKYEIYEPFASKIERGRERLLGVRNPSPFIFCRNIILKYVLRRRRHPGYDGGVERKKNISAFERETRRADDRRRP